MRILIVSAMHISLVLTFKFLTFKLFLRKNDERYLTSSWDDVILLLIDALPSAHWT